MSQYASLPGIGACEFGNADLFDENKYELPNSQAPIPGREAYWDMDTPETKRFRESLKVSNSPLDEPELHPDASPTLVDAKLKLKPRRRLEHLPEEKVKAGESALEQAMKLCREADEEEERERLKEEEEMRRWRMEEELEEMED